MAIKKLVRDKTPALFKNDEAEVITDQTELNKLYALKVKEELIEIQQADHKDIMEFVDLIEVAYSFAEQNGFSRQAINDARAEKVFKKGTFSDIALNNLNPNNPSNEIYFKNKIIEEIESPKLQLFKHMNLLIPKEYQSDKQLDQLRFEASLNAVEELLNYLKK
jgi:predicted house-cleaning noncanonical NTP pyrophosphatase (MazG superfamily)